MPVLQKWFEFLSNSVYFDLYEKKGFLYKDKDLGLLSYLEKHGTDEIFSQGRKIYRGKHIVAYAG